jgi:hypothetical protein
VWELRHNLSAYDAVLRRAGRGARYKGAHVRRSAGACARSGAPRRARQTPGLKSIGRPMFATFRQPVLFDQRGHRIIVRVRTIGLTGRRAWVCLEDAPGKSRLYPKLYPVVRQKAVR